VVLTLSVRALSRVLSRSRPCDWSSSIAFLTAFNRAADRASAASASRAKSGEKMFSIIAWQIGRDSSLAALKTATICFSGVASTRPISSSVLIEGRALLTYNLRKRPVGSRRWLSKLLRHPLDESRPESPAFILDRHSVSETTCCLKIEIIGSLDINSDSACWLGSDDVDKTRSATSPMQWTIRVSEYRHSLYCSIRKR
jgi:hypothetical protein